MTISDYLVQVSRLLHCQFEIYGSSVAAEKVFAPEGMLPAFFKRAENLSLFVLNKPLGIIFEKVPQSMNGTRVRCDDSVPNSYRILCLMDILVELLHESGSQKVIKLDQLLYD